MQPTNRKLGRLPRAHDDRIPKYSMIRRRLPAPPPSVNYAASMPANLGVMLNDTLGDCTCAAVGHAIQTWSFNAQGSMITPTDAQIEALYEEAGGYVPGNPNTDNGAVIQTVLKDWMNGDVDDNKLAAYVEIDQMTPTVMKQAIFESGVVDIGFNVPSYMSMNAGAIWDVDPGADNSIIGGHSVVLVGYQTNGTYIVISWGDIFYATPAFIFKFCDEAYALANAAWIGKTGQSPAGLSLAELEALMTSLQDGPQPNDANRQHRHHRRQMKKAKWGAQNN